MHRVNLQHNNKTAPPESHFHMSFTISRIHQKCAAVVFLALAIVSCSREEPEEILSDRADLISFVLSKADNPSLSADLHGIRNRNLFYMTVPEGVDLTSLKPSLTVSPGATVRINNVPVTSNVNNTATGTSDYNPGANISDSNLSAKSSGSNSPAGIAAIPWQVAIAAIPWQVAIAVIPWQVAIAAVPWQVAIAAIPWQVAVAAIPWQPGVYLLWILLGW